MVVEKALYLEFLEDCGHCFPENCTDPPLKNYSISLKDPICLGVL